MPLLKGQIGHYVRKWRIDQLLEIGVVQEYREILFYKQPVRFPCADEGEGDRGLWIE